MSFNKIDFLFSCTEVALHILVMVFDEDMTETEFHIVVEWLLSLFFSFPFKPMFQLLLFDKLL